MTTITRTQCPRCAANGGDNSEDNLATYSDDNHSHCYSCGYHTYGDVINNGEPEDSVAFVIRELQTRNITKETCQKFGYGVGQFGGDWVCLENYFKESQLVGQKIRTKDKKFPKRGDITQLYGQWLWEPNKTTPIVITEGAIDAMSVFEALPTTKVVSLSNGAQGACKELIRALSFLKGFKGVILAFDSDQAGQDAVNAILCNDELKSLQFEVAVPTKKDWNEMLGDGDIARIISKAAQSFTLIADWNLLSVEELNQPRPPGLKLDMPMFDQMTNGLQKGVISCLISGSGYGKSTFVFHLINRFHKDLKVGVICLEHSFKELVNSLVCLEVGANRADMDKGLVKIDNTAYSDALNKIKQNVVIMEPYKRYDISAIQAAIVEMKEAGCDFVLLDNFNSALDASPTKDKFAQQGEVAGQLQELIKRSDIYFLMVAQVNKEANTKDKDGWYQYLQKSLTGSSSILYNIKLLFSIDYLPKDAGKPAKRRLSVLKNNIYGSEGPADEFSLNPSNGRLEILEETHQQF